MSTVIRKDSEIWKKLTRGFLPKQVLIGVPESAGGEDGSDLTVADVALINHDGTATIPARPFLAQPLDGRTTEVRAFMAKVAKALYRNPAQVDTILGAVGEWGRNRVITAINAGFSPANAPSTIAAKGSSTPLVDTGQLKGSIKYEIRGS